jgi:hypothetical protein
MSLVFCFPTRDISRDVVETWSFGLGDPWFESIRNYAKGHNIGKLHFGTKSFLVGCMACLHWIWFTMLVRAEWLAGNRLPKKDVVFTWDLIRVENGTQHIDWRRIILSGAIACTIACTIACVACCMFVVLMQVALGGAPSPGTVMIWNSIMACAFIGFMVKRSLKHHTPPKHPGSSARAVQAFWDLMEKGAYEKCWFVSAPAFKETQQQERWIQKMETERKPFGKATTRKTLSLELIEPNIRFEQHILTEFENGKSAQESILCGRQPDGDVVGRHSYPFQSIKKAWPKDTSM